MNQEKTPPDFYTAMIGDDRTPFELKLTNLPGAAFGSYVADAVRRTAKEHFPDLAEFFPFRHAVTAKAHVGTNYLIATAISSQGVHRVDEFTADELAELEAAAKRCPMSHEDLATLISAKWFSSERFTYIGPHRESSLCWPHLLIHLDVWLKKHVLPEILERNQRRIERAIPPAPAFDISRILGSLWVLESESHSSQGTGFDLPGVGLITAAHVLASDTVAFRSSELTQRLPVRLLRKNDAIDVAVCDVGVESQGGLEKGTADNISVMDHILVAGFPNFRSGDSGLITPGIVTGFRVVSAIRRILTNAPIIAGNSGGPVLGADGKVIGVAVTGAENTSTAHETENHGVIPIDALQHLNA
jgi:S1-C subfamily serine protease